MKALRKAFGYPPVGCAVISLLVMGALLKLRDRGWLQRPELIFYDFFVRQRAQDKMAPDSRIVICGMTEADLVKYGHPLDDEKLAKLLEKIAAAEPCVVGLDIYRDLKEPRPGEHYPEFAKTLLRLENVIAIERIPTIKPPPILKDRLDRVAPNNFPFDDEVDGVCRRACLLFESDVSQPRESLALALADIYLTAHHVQVGMVDALGDNPRLRLGKTTFPRLTPNAGGYHGLKVWDYEFLADYRSSQNFRVISFGEILEKAPFVDALKDAIVIVGVTTPSVKDNVATPVDPSLRGPIHHAMIVDQLLRAALAGESPTGWLPEKAENAWIGLCAVLGGMLGLALRSPWRLAPALTLLIGAIVGAGWAALRHALWIPTITPALGAFVAATFVTSYVVFLEHSDRRVLRALFSRHVSKEVLDVLWAERDQLLDGGRLKPQRVTATVLFTDLKDYATIAEHMDPADLMNWVNEHTSRIAPLVESHGGIVNSYGGDAVMAVFGAPVPHTSEKEIDRDAIRAVECALAIREALKELNDGWAARGMPTVSMRVGIYTGPVVTGSIGSMNRLEYTALGDTTNIAARLQNLGKEFSNDEATAPCTILIGDSTWQRMPGRFTTQCLGAKRLKGKSNEVIVHSVLSASPQPSSL